jgi:hypothetical protein
MSGVKGPPETVTVVPMVTIAGVTETISCAERGKGHKAKIREIIIRRCRMLPPWKRGSTQI